MSQLTCEKCGKKDHFTKDMWNLTIHNEIFCDDCFSVKEHTLKKEPNFGKFGDTGWFIVDPLEENIMIYGPYETEPELIKGMLYWGGWREKRDLIMFGTLTHNCIVEPTISKEVNI